MGVTYKRVRYYGIDEYIPVPVVPPGKRYRVYSVKTGELIVEGGVIKCAAALHIKPETFRGAAYIQRHPDKYPCKHRKYIIKEKVMNGNDQRAPAALSHDHS